MLVPRIDCESMTAVFPGLAQHRLAPGRAAASVGKVKGSARTGAWFPRVPQLVALCAGSAGTSSPRNWPATRITVDAAG